MSVMRNLIIRNLNELPKNFSTGELAYYTMTNGFELHIRNNLAYNLQYRLIKYDVLREWNSVDLSIHRDGKCYCLIELKNSKSCNLLKKRNPSNSNLLKSLYSQYKSFHKSKIPWYGVIFVSHPRNEIPAKYRNKVRNYLSVNKYVREKLSTRKVRLSIKDIIHLHFSEDKFKIASKTMDIGTFFETRVDLFWFLISKK